jgi:hypothetical protein
LVAVVSTEPSSQTERRAFCAVVSSARDEPLAATASRIDHWILVEYRGAWARDVLGDCLFSPELKAHLRDQLAALERSRLLFVKKPERRSQTGRRVFFGTSRPGQERFFELEVEHQNDLLGFDFAAALEGCGPASPLEGPLYVVCTHGKRDRCCAKFGRPVYEELSRLAGSESVWQCSHVGGDRFAGNLVVLPAGLYLGRVEPAEAWETLDEVLAGRIPLGHYRGRSCHPFAVQAADRAVRVATGLLGVDDVRLDEARAEPDGWRVRLKTTRGELWEVEVERRDGPLTQLTCSSPGLRHPRHFAARTPPVRVA